MLPSSRVRAFATWFYQLKCNLLQFEINNAGIPAYQWEKKGASLYTTTNVLKYRELRNATFRLLNRIERDGGIVFYVGIQKTHPTFPKPSVIQRPRINGVPPIQGRRNLGAQRIGVCTADLPLDVEQLLRVHRK